jgi:Gluconate 2-dehydrogenase subunit 3
MSEEVIFTEDQIDIIQAVAEIMLPADDFDGGAGELSPGYVVATRVRYQPPVADMYLKGFKGIQDSVDLIFGQGKKFVDLSPEEKTVILTAMQKGVIPGKGWEEVNPQKFWGAMRSDILFIYATDPDVCERIGFQGKSALEGGYSDFADPQS